MLKNVLQGGRKQHQVGTWTYREEKIALHAISKVVNVVVALFLPIISSGDTYP